MRKRCLRCLTAICFVSLSITGIFMSQPAAAVHAQGISDEIVYAPLESTGEYQITMEGISGGEVFQRQTASFVNQTLYTTSEEYSLSQDLLSPYYTSLISVLLANVAIVMSVVNIFRSRKNEEDNDHVSD